MRLITASTIKDFAQVHADPALAQALADWVAMVEAAHWTSGDHMVFSSSFPARALPSRRAIFNIRGNNYRIVCSVRYADPSQQLNGIVRVEFIGTHAEYDRIDAETVTFRSRGR